MIDTARSVSKPNLAAERRIGDTLAHAKIDSKHPASPPNAPRPALEQPLLRAFIVLYSSRFSDLYKKAAARTAASFFVGYLSSRKIKMSVPAAFLGVVLIWATTPLAIKWSSEGAGFLFGVASRMVLGVVVCLLLVALVSRRMRWHREALLTYLAAGIGLWGAMTSVYWSAQFIPSGLISVLFGLSPAVTGIMAAIWLGERVLTPFRLLGLGLGIAGLSVVFAEGLAMGAGATLGIAGVLLSVHIHAASAVWVKRIGAGVPALETTTGALIIAVPLFLANWAVLDGHLPSELAPRTAWSIVYLAVFGSALGFILYFYVLRHVEASRVALITLVTPVIALFLGYEVNGETIGPRELAGTAIILIGLACYQLGDRWSGRRA